MIERSICVKIDERGDVKRYLVPNRHWCWVGDGRVRNVTWGQYKLTRERFYEIVTMVWWGEMAYIYYLYPRFIPTLVHAVTRAPDYSHSLGAQ